MDPTESGQISYYYNGSLVNQWWNVSSLNSPEDLLWWKNGNKDAFTTEMGQLVIKSSF